VTARINNVKDGLSLQSNGIDNVHGKEFTGAVGNIINQLEDNLTGGLFLGNIHGSGGIANLADAISAGSLNGIANVVTNGFGSFASNNTNKAISIDENIHPIGIDSSPDGSINSNVHE
jgi:hypothetical protein